MNSLSFIQAGNLAKLRWFQCFTDSRTFAGTWRTGLCWSFQGGLWKFFWFRWVKWCTCRLRNWHSDLCGCMGCKLGLLHYLCSSLLIFLVWTCSVHCTISLQFWQQPSPAWSCGQSWRPVQQPRPSHCPHARKSSQNPPPIRCQDVRIVNSPFFTNNSALPSCFISTIKRVAPCGKTCLRLCSIRQLPHYHLALQRIQLWNLTTLHV